MSVRQGGNIVNAARECMMYASSSVVCGTALGALLHMSE